MPSRGGDFNLNFLRFYHFFDKSDAQSFAYLAFFGLIIDIFGKTLYDIFSYGSEMATMHRQG